MRSLLIYLLWAYKGTIPRGRPYPSIVVRLEDYLWGWSMRGVRR